MSNDINQTAIICSAYPVATRLLESACSYFFLNRIIASNLDHAKEALMGNEAASFLFLDFSFSSQFGPEAVKDALQQAQANYKKGNNNLTVLFCSNRIADYSEYAKSIAADAVLPMPFPLSLFNQTIKSLIKTQRHILIIGHQKQSLEAFAIALRAIGYTVTIASAINQVLEHSQKKTIDLLLVEYDPNQNDNFLALLDHIPNEKAIPVMALLSQNDSAIVEQSFASGITDILLAPYTQKQNIDKITALVAPQNEKSRGLALVIDDSRMIRSMIINMFDQLGYEVAEAENGRQGLEQAKKKTPTIITCDYDMPIMNGWEFCMAAKDEELIREIPIIMVTARGTEIDKKKGSVLGVADYLTKPFKMEQLKKSVANAMAFAKERKEKKAMSKYVSTDVLDNIDSISGGSRQKEPEEKFLTILFSDIRSFTPKCEKLEPKRLVTLLNHFFEIMITILHDHGAIIDKLIGDAIVARFNSGDRTQDAIQAIKAALVMLQQLEILNEDKTQDIEKIEIRIGINSGNVILGSIGCNKYRLDYTMIGDHVNIAARLESVAPVMGCLISENSYELVKDHVEVGAPLAYYLKGKSRKITAYPLIAIRR